MNITDPNILSLQQRVMAAAQEFEMAVMFHETWKPTVYDNDLHRRMGTSYATNTLNVVRVALRREMVLALMRLWDTPRHTPRLEHIARTLRDPRVIDALATDRAAPFPEAEDQMRQDLARRASEAIALIEKYSNGNPGYRVRHELQRMRNERLAHRAMRPDTTAGPTASDDEIEAFYCDNSIIVRLLLSVVNAIAHDPATTGEVFHTYATHFWAGVCGERTEGHPNFRKRFIPTTSPSDG
jgi:hypothetical protein